MKEFSLETNKLHFVRYKVFAESSLDTSQYHMYATPLMFDAGGGVQPVERQICDDTNDGRLILHVDDTTNTASRYCGSTYHILLVQ